MALSILKFLRTKCNETEHWDGYFDVLCLDLYEAFFTFVEIGVGRSIRLF
jgi:hypothetical protein